MFENEQWARLLLGFVDEARESVRTAETLLLQLERAPDDAQAVEELFRLMHTFKGTAGLFDLKPIVQFTHRLENVLSDIRLGRLGLDPPVVRLMLDGLDEIVSMIELIDAQSGELPVDEVHQAELLAAFDAMTGARNAPLLHPTGVSPACLSEALAPASRLWHLSLRFDEGAFAQGIDPLALVEALNRLGTIMLIDTLDGPLPAMAEMDPERCYLGLDVQLQSTASKAQIQDHFEFVRPFCLVTVRPEPGGTDDDAADEDTLIGHLLLSSGALTLAQLSQGLAAQQRPAAFKAPLGAVLIEEGLVPAERVRDALQMQQHVRQRRAQEGRGIRVAAHKLDQLVELVGQLVISTAGAQASAELSGFSEGVERLCAVSEHVALLRETALGLRMVEIGESFSRFQRVVRDVSNQLHKDIALEIQGADTELDKLVIDRLADPLTHLVRNAITHGIEPAAERQRAGKTAQGRLRLCARQESGVVVIEVSDDGQGLDWEKIRRRAVELDLIEPHSDVDQRELRALIFTQGFSTAGQVSELSGRGVGLDVVRGVITDLRGEIEVESRRGAGTLFRIRVPLTLTIINGFRFSVADEHFVVPLETVLECQEWNGPNGQLHGSFSRHGRLLPFIDLAVLFNGCSPRRDARRNALVVSCGSEIRGLVVDELHGELQTVVKPLGPIFRHLPGISGATVLGCGQIALVLDVAHLFQTVTQHADACAPQLAASPPRPTHRAEE